MTTHSESAPVAPPEGSVLTTDGDGRVGVFDGHHPPSAERIADCVHCGFCLPSCPTYALWGEEMDSPRGRIYLMKLAREGRIELDDTFVGHIDACLGCMACVTACPSGVAYDELIEATRPQIERNYERSVADRAFRSLVYALFPHPARLRVAALLGKVYQAGFRNLAHGTGLVGRLPARMQALEALMPPLALRDLTAKLPEVTPAAGGRPRRRVGMVTGCVQRVYFHRVNEATVRVLAAEGCEVVTPRTQGCCGALLVHSGQEPGALDRARALIDTFEDAGCDMVVINAAGCGSSLKEYGRLLADDPVYAERAAAFSATVRDVTELLAELQADGGPRAPRHPINARVAYHDACHLALAQKVTAEPRQVLRAIPGMEVVDIPEAELCCGSAGIYNLTEPEAAADLGRRKARNIGAVEPQVVATANPGCLLQIRRYMGDGEVPLFHPVELVDASIGGMDLLAAATEMGGRTDARRMGVAVGALAAGAAAVSVVAVAARAWFKHCRNRPTAEASCND
jgi:glycolate oxidase iron-sulfur subunit